MLFFETYEQTSGNTSVAKVEEFLSGKRRFSTEIEKEAFLLVKQLFDDGIFTLDSLDTDSEGMRGRILPTEGGDVLRRHMGIWCGKKMWLKILRSGSLNSP